ncbi:MAG: erythromycin esterase family protein, partial [Ferruginibacter sp.]
MKTLILAFALLTFINSNAQDIKKNIQDNIHEISINPEDTSYADLSYLAEAIKNVRVVMLGEQDHGDGTTFLAKTRIVKFLHEKLGYNVLAFESDFLSVNLAWSQVEEKKISVKEAINRNIYPVWTNCSQCDGLFKYIEAISGTPDPLKLTGFDNQLTGVTGYLNIKNILLDSIKHYDPAFLENQGVSFSLKIDTAVDLLGGKSQIKNINKKEFYKSFIKSLSVIEERVAKVTTADNSFLILIKSIKSFYTEIEHLINNEKLSTGQERDHQMAENLEWIIQTK